MADTTAGTEPEEQTELKRAIGPKLLLFFVIGAFRLLPLISGLRLVQPGRDDGGATSRRREILCVRPAVGSPALARLEPHHVGVVGFASGGN